MVNCCSKLLLQSRQKFTIVSKTLLALLEFYSGIFISASLTVGDEQKVEEFNKFISSEA